MTGLITWCKLIRYKSLNLACMNLTKAWKTAGTFCQPLLTGPGSWEVSDRAAPLRIQGLRRCIPAGRALVNREGMEFTWTWAGEPISSWVTVSNQWTLVLFHLKCQIVMESFCTIEIKLENIDSTDKGFIYQLYNYNYGLIMIMLMHNCCGIPVLDLF